MDLLLPVHVPHRPLDLVRERLRFEPEDGLTGWRDVAGELPGGSCQGDVKLTTINTNQTQINAIYVGE